MDIKQQLEKQQKGKKQKSKEELHKEMEIKTKRANKANTYISNEMQKDFIEKFNATISINADRMYTGLRLVPLTSKNGYAIFGIAIPENGFELRATGLTDEEKQDYLKKIEEENKTK